MATRMAARFVSRRLSSSGKILSEEEKAAENIFIKKTEKEKLEKLARKGPTPGEPAQSVPEAQTVHQAQPSSGPSSATGGVSTDKNRNYAVLAGTVAALSAFGWYYFSKPKKTEEIAD